jgi:phosphatidylinositol glycan class Q protein
MFKFILPFLLRLIIYSGLMGLSFSLCAILDVLKILTIHHYCFYIYALRIYKLEIESLKSLFRLFRGKKLNPLRSRIDSYSYQIDQLLIGTLSFCIVFFLMPTVFMYYMIFLSLRIIILVIYFFMKFIIVSLNNIPIYELVLCFIRSAAISDNIEFTVCTGRFTGNKHCFFNARKIKMNLDQLLKESQCQLFQIKFNFLKHVSKAINGVKL